MEQDPETSGNGNRYRTEFRQYDPRLGRWKSLDPAAYAFPHQSPYCAMDNNPILFNDPLGDSVRYQNFGDRFRVFMARTFNKKFRNDFKEKKESLDVFTYDKSKEFTNDDSGNPKRQIHAKTCEIECKTRDDGTSYSTNVIYYRNGLQLKDVSSPWVRIPLRIMVAPIRLGVNITWAVIKIPVALTFGIGIGIWNLATFWNKDLHVGRGLANRFETLGGLNIFSYGFGNYNTYNWFGMRLDRTPNMNVKINPNDENAGLFGLRFGVGKKKPVNFIDIGQQISTNGINFYHFHINLASKAV